MAKTLFTGSVRLSGRGGNERSHLPDGGGAVSAQRCQHREAAKAVARHWQCGGQPNGWTPATAVDGRVRMAASADRRKAWSNLAVGGGRACSARHAGKLWGGVALLAA